MAWQRHRTVSPLALAGLLALTACVTPVAHAGAASTPAVAASAAVHAPLDSASLIRRLQDGARVRSYTGTYVVTASGEMSSARIVHGWDGNTPIERVESLDGQMRRVYRYNNSVHVLWPASRQASIEPRGALRGFPSQLPSTGVTTLDMYDIQGGAEDRIAGHDALTVTLKPRDNARFMQRWWLERQTGLLLRADVVNDRGDVLESAAFTELQLGARVPVQALLVEMNRLDGYRVNRSRIINTDLEREGWTLRSPVAGFRSVQCVQRLMAEPGPLPSATQGPNAVNTLTPATGAGISVGAITPEPGGGLVQAIYSDGLTHVSIFIEGFRPGTHAPEPMVAMGATYAIVRRQGDWWITVVGDVPPSTLRQFAQALERRKP